MKPARCEIAVVGGGVVGAAAALGLAQAGFDVRLLERTPPPPMPAADYDLRVYAMAPGSARFLAALGAWPLPAERVCAYEAMRIWEAQPERALNFRAADAGRDCLGWIVEQSQLLHALWSALPAGVAQPGSSLAAAEFGEAGAQLRLGDGSSLQAALVLGAEGALSQLRDWAGIDVVDRSYGQRALVAHLRTDEPHRGIALQRFLPGGPLAFLPLADGRRSIVWSLPLAEAGRLEQLGEAAFRQALGSAIQGAAGAVLDCTRRVSFPLRMLHAKDYVRPGLALLGDSAHVVHPLAGQGVNLGLGDAECLVRELVGARAAGRDWSGLRVLRRYARARKAANLEMLALTDGLDRAFRSAAPGLPRLLDFGLSALDRLAPVKRLLVRRALGQ